MRPMLTVAELAELAGGLLLAAVLGTWPGATADPEAAAEEVDEEDEEGGAACWRRRARCPSLTIWIMASASASSCRTAAWILLVELRLLEPATTSRENQIITQNPNMLYYTWRMFCEVLQWLSESGSEIQIGKFIVSANMDSPLEPLANPFKLNFQSAGQF